MSIIGNISRRLSMLTTDAKPDPPRINITENTNNLPTTNFTPKIPDSVHNSTTDDHSDPLKSQDNSSGNDTKKNTREKRIPRVKRQSSSSKNATNIVNYNIINSSGVKIGATTTYICNINQANENLKDTGNQSNNPPPKMTTPRPMPDTVEALSMSEKELTIVDMYHIKSHIGSDWREVFKSLGYSQGQLDQFAENHKSKGLDELIYQILVDWKQANGREAYIGTILKALWKCQQYDCAVRLTSAQIIS